MSRKRPSRPFSEFDLLLDAIGQPVAATDVEGRVRLMNGAACELLGYSHGELVGVDATDLVPVDMRGRVRSLLAFVQSGQVWSGRILARRKDGHELPVSLVARPLRNAQGEILGVVGIATDISRELATEARFRALFESASMGVAMASPDGMIVEWNPALAEMLGFGADALPIHGAAVTHPEDMQKEERSMQALLDGRADGYQLEKRYLRKDGSILWGSLRATVVRDEHNRMICVLSLIEDITERKQMERALRESEERHRALVELAPDGIVVHREGSILYANPAAARMLDLSDPASLEGRSFRDLGHEGAHVDVREAPIPYEGTNARIVVLRDLSERVAMEHDLRELAARLASVREEEQARVSRELHDDLGQRLTALKLELSWLRRKAEQEDAAPLRALVELKVDELVGLLDDTIGSMRNMLLDLRPMVLDDLGLQAAVEWHVARFAERTGLRCHLDVALPGLAPRSDRDSACFRILQEALTNVARHAQAQRVWVRLACEDALVLAIRDDGVGIDHERNGRPALGIVGMRERARALGGTIELRPAEERGTIVTARLPW